MFKGLSLVALILLSLCSATHAVSAVGHGAFNFSNGNFTEVCDTECVLREFFLDGSNSTTTTTGVDVNVTANASGSTISCHDVCFVYTIDSGGNWTETYVSNNSSVPHINYTDYDDSCWNCGFVTIPTCYYVNTNSTNSTDSVYVWDEWEYWNDTDWTDDWNDPVASSGAMEAPGNITMERRCFYAYSQTCYDNCTFEDNPYVGIYGEPNAVNRNDTDGISNSSSSSSSSNNNNSISLDTIYHTLKFPVVINGEDPCDAGVSGEDALVKAVMDALFVDTSASDWDQGMVSITPGEPGSNMTGDYVFSVAIKASNEDVSDIILGGVEFNYEHADFASNVYDNLVEQGGELPCSLSGASALEFGALTLDCPECSGSVVTQVAYTALALMTAIQIYV